MREFSLSQLKRLNGPDRYVYTENVSKTNSGTFKRLSIQNKVVPVYACPDAKERCAVYLLDLYISKLPPRVLTDDIFYVRPLDMVPSDPSKPWYSTTAVGKNQLEKKLAKICKRAGISGNITNHSLRATSATQLYRSGVPEKVIQERTGHRSLEALRVYERSDSLQHQAACNTLMGSSSSCKTTHKSVQQMAYQQTVAAFPSNAMCPQFSFGYLHGCTININSSSSAPSATVTPTITSSAMNISQTELDELLSDF